MIGKKKKKPKSGKDPHGPGKGFSKAQKKTMAKGKSTSSGVGLPKRVKKSMRKATPGKGAHKSTIMSVRAGQAASRGKQLGKKKK